MAKHELWELQSMQAAPLSTKIALTESRIREWIREYGEDGVAISFSGGKDSTVLMDIVRNRMGYKDIPAVFVDVPTQYPELKKFALTWDKVEVLRPKISFMEVCEKYGFPLISKEVSECVYGARKYLTKALEQMHNSETDRQTIPYAYCYDRVTGQGKYQKTENIPSNAEICETEHMKAVMGGYSHYYKYECDRIFGTCRQDKRSETFGEGYDNKYRKLRGIGEYNAKGLGEEWERLQNGTITRVSDKREPHDKGEYP